ncbi:MAG: hypothetical protein PSW75_11495, partial [bacterium]|nr:hypothetical protein [bacterium]
MKTSLIVVLCGALLGLASSALAQSTPPPLPPESHQFDFWIGEWNVTTPDGKPAGLSKIESVSSGA